MNVDCVGRFIEVEEDKSKLIKFVEEQVSEISREYNVGERDIENLLIKIAKARTSGISIDGFEDSERKIIERLYKRGRIVGITPDKRVCLERKTYFYLGR